MDTKSFAFLNNLHVNKKILATLILLLIPFFGISFYGDYASHLSIGRVVLYTISIVLFIIVTSLYFDITNYKNQNGDPQGGIGRALNVLLAFFLLFIIWLSWFLYFAFTKDFIKVGVLIVVLLGAFTPYLYDKYKNTFKECMTSIFHKTYPLNGIDITTKYTYPIKILNFDITYQNGEKRHLYGRGGCSNSMEKEDSTLFDLPHKKSLLIEKLSIYYFSYIDNAFYQGDGDIPLDREEEIIKTTQSRIKGDWIHTYINIYPKGEISVSFKWIPYTSSFNDEKLINLKANIVEGDWKLILNNPDISREEYIRKFLNRTNE